MCCSSRVSEPTRALLLVSIAVVSVSACACAPEAATEAARSDRGPARPAAPAREAAAPAAPAPPVGADLAGEARWLHRTAACAGDAPLASAEVSEIVESHCRYQRAVYARHRKRVLARAGPFLAALRPSGLPRRVVYPFGGGDLLHALTAFPDAEELTTIALERSGDIRGVDRLGAEALRLGLRDVAWMTMRLAIVEYSFTTHMGAMEQSRMPIQIALALAALAIHGHEPVSLRYFRIAADGSLHYLSREELASSAVSAARHVAPRPGKGRRGRRRRAAPRIPEAFANVEIGFRPTRGGPTRVYRHIAANLDDRHLRGSGLLRHLEAKGRIAAMTKAASYLLWLDDFSLIRGYLLGQMEWMVSDSTGILPRHAQAAGFEQLTYGRFKRSLLGTAQDANVEMGRLWASQAHRPLPFAFGYPDFDNRSAHLLITRRRSP